MNNNIKPELQKLINDKFNEFQMLEVKEMLSYERDRFIVYYSILATAIKDDLVSLEPEEIKEFYNVEDLNVLNVVDILIAKIIVTLSNKLNIDVKSEFERRTKLDKIQPELLYLIELINENY